MIIFNVRTENYIYNLEKHVIFLINDECHIHDK